MRIGGLAVAGCGMSGSRSRSWLARIAIKAGDAVESDRGRVSALPVHPRSRSRRFADATLLHRPVGSNIVSDRSFRYWRSRAAFSVAAHRITITTRYPRNAGTPLETFVVIAEHLPGEDAYEVAANFQGPLGDAPGHGAGARGSGEPAAPQNAARFRRQLWGEARGLAYVVMMSLAARKAGRPVKWVETRLEHLTAATSATNRVTTLTRP